MQGAIQGYGNSMGSFASMLGLILGGILFETMGTMVFFIGGVIFLIVTFLMTVNFLQRRKKEKIATEPISA